MPETSITAYVGVNSANWPLIYSIMIVYYTANIRIFIGMAMDRVAAAIFFTLNEDVLVKNGQELSILGYLTFLDKMQYIL